LVGGVLGGLVEGGGHVGEARAAQFCQVGLAVVGDGLQGGVMLLAGVGKHVARDFGRYLGQVGAGLLLVAGLAGHLGNSAALGRAACAR